jgi:hypothetical protein
MLCIYINCLISCVFEGINILMCRVESWILHGVPRVEKGCGTLTYTVKIVDIMESVLKVYRDKSINAWLHLILMLRHCFLCSIVLLEGGTLVINVHFFAIFEVLTVLTMKNDVFWDVALWKYFVNWHFRGMYRLHLQGIRYPQAMNQRVCRPSTDTC